MAFNGAPDCKFRLEFASKNIVTQKSTEEFADNGNIIRINSQTKTSETISTLLKYESISLQTTIAK